MIIDALHRTSPKSDQAGTEKYRGKQKSFAGVAQLVEQLIRNQ